MCHGAENIIRGVWLVHAGQKTESVRREKCV